MPKGGVVVWLAVLPARLIGMAASLPLMAAPFILVWTVLARLRNGRWPPSSVADLAHWVRWPSPPGAEHIPMWLALGVTGWLGLHLSTFVAKRSLAAVEAWVDARRPATRPTAP